MKFKNDIEIQAGLRDNADNLGTSGQVLTSTGTQVEWATVSGGGGVTGTGVANQLAIWNTTSGLASSNISQDITGNVAVSTNLTASGNLTLSSALSAGGSTGLSGQVLTSTGSGVIWNTPVSVPAAFKAITIENPGNSENITLFYTPEAITLSRFSAVIQGAGSVPYIVSYGSSRTTGTATSTVNVVSSTTTAQNVTSFTNANIPANNWVWLTTVTTTGTPTSFNLTISYTKT